MLSLNNRSGKFIGLVALALVAVALLFNLLMHKFFVIEKGPKVSCAAFFLVQSDLQTKGVMSLHIDGQRHGEMAISATVRDNAGTIKYHLLRNVSFEYRYEDNGYLALQLVDINKKASDDMPNELFNQSIFDFSVKNRRLRITMTGDGYLLWNGFSPVMMCVRSQ
ncbi:hypothetical protein [Serratia fonticola]|jgi:hypothetical protein|uniref:Uncharacterized protein n=1 Tax=Serratia fonticola TaxID=47917 RepID=A0A448S8W8_SERFO|nr:hypothetical protein [Serratia fonticola]CAI1012867.1 Uncharacterised protein [Serratia fonticola]CAI1013872.1 Uncharacterised protein [Serratia fonticola]CAI1542606.1 Uncharacterised protein [Serratia fonticola]CAI1615905.1 Uncharacterised protein [Serratia fonticola]CAI1737547.1 Uncharacterised protein [Serratia fonticola]